MGVIHANLFSDALQMHISYTAILPEGMEGPYPVLYLLHGLSDDDHAWLHQTSLVRYAQKRKVAIFMPQVHRSFYTDMKHGGKYWTFISEEFPQKMNRLFRISTKREDTFVAGLSMGGYGAFKLASAYPERFHKAASFSGAVDIALSWSKDQSRDDLFGDIYGTLEQFESSDDNLFTLFNKLKENEKKPSFYLACGTDDFILDGNRHFYETFKNDFDLSYVEEPGDHNWEFWDRHILLALEWMGIEKVK